jgi:hypothetical protein
VLGLGADGKIAAFVDAPYSTTADLVVDVTGYFRPSALVQQWREWEETLLSPEDYTVGGGDPYSEVSLDIRFTDAAAGRTFVQPAVWDGDDTAPRAFKVRTAVPAGTWTWQIESCTHNGVSCLAGWSPNQGSLFVQSNTASGNPLYDRGFVEQVATTSGGQTVVYSELQFPDSLAFSWIGDTAWTAPPREFDPDGSGPQTAQTAAWDAYLADRKNKGFTGVQIAPAVTWPSAGLPAAKGFSFTKKASCSDTIASSTPIPNTSCWQPRKAYWDHFKSMVRSANQKGMVVVVVGVMNPVGIDAKATYPNTASAVKFARYLVGLLSGLDVIFSPGFDDDADQKDPAPPAGTGQPRQVLMDAVGNALKTAPNPSGKARPLTNHLSGGSSNCDEYQYFATSGWMTHYMFQSGHGGAQDTLGPCAVNSTDDVRNAMERARVMPLTLSSYAPKLPSINSEGPYDKTNFPGPVSHPNVNTRYRSRQAGYLGALSNAVGYSYGAYGLSLWDNPSLYFDLASANDMTRLKNNLQSKKLVSHPEWIKNNPVEQKYKMVLASDESSFVMAYLPGDEGSQGSSSSQIQIDATKLPCQVCPSQNGSPWSFTWSNPITNTVFSGSCSGPVAGKLTFTRPGCITTSDKEANASCDWLLRIEKTGLCPTAQAETTTWHNDKESAGNPPALEAWSEASSGDGTSAIYAAFTGPGGREEPVLLSPAGKAFQLAPRVGRFGSRHLVVWQADGLDGSLYGIYGALLDARGKITGPFKINHYTEHDQREPAIAGGIGGNALVVWSSYGQDGDRGGIFGRLVKTKGHGEDALPAYLGEEIEIAETREGHQQRPQVLADAGGFWVAWETVDENGLSQGLSVRRLGMDGRPESTEIQLPAEAGEQRKLLTLDDPTPNAIVVRWWRQNVRGGLLESLQQVIGPHGPSGPVTPRSD